MSAWIKWSKDLETDPRVTRMVTRFMREARKRHGERDAHRNAEVVEGVTSSVLTSKTGLSIVCGCLVRFWSFADSHVRADDTLDMTFDEIDELVGVPGFAAMMPDDWLMQVDDTTVELPNFQQHNGVVANKKALNAKRQKRHREKNRVTPSVTPALPRPDQTRPEETKSESDLDVSSPSQGELRVQADDEPSPPPKGEPPGFAAIRLAYPKRSGDQRWADAMSAYRARVKEGHTPEVILAGVKRYAKFIRGKGDEGTEWVKQAATFLGTNRSFLQPWDAAPTRGEQREQHNVDATQAFIDEMRGNHAAE